MKIGILGTGIVGTTIGSKLISSGHQVMMGSRTKENEKMSAWVKKSGANASGGIFKDAAAFGEMIFNCTSGGVSLDVLKMAGAENLRGKIIVDISNPLDFSKGMPPILIPSLSNTTSVGEEIQKAFPESKVVKTLNTMNCFLMVDPSLIAGSHDVFISGNDESSKQKIKDLLKTFGWSSPIDLGDITTARGTEQILPLWLRLYGLYKNADFNFSIVRK